MDSCGQSLDERSACATSELNPVRVAVVGGGCAALAAAFELTAPALGGRYAVTVYQMGWRLGGKGASGRGPSQRVEEHGLHLWMGYYENAFRLLRRCYAELGRDPRRCRIADWPDALRPANSNVAMDWSPRGAWLPWKVDFPPAAGLPGDADPPRWSVTDYLARSVSLVGTLLQTLQARQHEVLSSSALFPELGGRPLTPEGLRDALSRLLKFGSLAGWGAALEGVRLLELALEGLADHPQSLVAELLEVVSSALRQRLDRLIQTDDDVRRLWEVSDLVLAVIRGSLRFRLAFDPRGFDAIDEYDCREWLRLNGASNAALDSAFIRSMYDLAFAYAEGDPARPRIAAGCALRGAMRAFFTYRGAFFWKLRAGMGDIVFAPLYEVLSRRGVRFEFFHKLQNVGLGQPLVGERPHVAELAFDVQAHPIGAVYQPLVDVSGLPCWPARPLFAQLRDGARLERERWDLESQWDSRRAGSKTLRVGEDFDMVVLGVGLGVIPYVCRDILAQDERWRDMVRHVRSVPTQAFQIWLDRPMTELGWRLGASNVSGFVEPFDTWADMTHLASEEGWSTPPKAIAYFCNVFPDSRSPVEGAAATEFVRQQHDIVRDNAVRFLEHDIQHLWPQAVDRSGAFCWNALLVESTVLELESTPDRARFDTQYWTANVRPSDLYTQALPGSTRYRISPLDDRYDNLTVAGDWTSCSLNMGCVEAAVMSGLLAAHAIAEYPPLEEIVGYDHP